MLEPKNWDKWVDPIGNKLLLAQSFDPYAVTDFTDARSSEC